MPIPRIEGGFTFDSYMKDSDMKPENGDIRLLAVDNEAVVPVNKVVRLQVTATDVIHSFVVQSFGVRIDAVPGRLNETWFKADREGVYYGQCSKICGKDHAFMPIAFRVVSEDKYQAWLADAKKKFAAAPSAIRVAALAPTRRFANSSRRLDANPNVETTDISRGNRVHGDRRLRITTTMATRPVGGATCTRPTTRTSARSIWSSRWSRA